MNKISVSFNRICGVSIFMLIMCQWMSYSSCESCSSSGRTDLKWETYTSAEGGFAVKMPPDPKRVEKVIVTPFGKQAATFVYWKPSNLNIDKFKLFQVSYTRCTSALSDSFSRERVLDNCINMRVKDFADIELETHTINFNGLEGRAFIYDVKDNNDIAIVKQCIANGKLYDLTVVLKRNYATNKEVHTFYNSFQVLYK